MTRLKQGDRVVCKLNLGKLVNCNESFDEKKIFEIIGLDEHGYCVYVPSYFNLNGSYTINQSDCNLYKINIKFFGDQMFYVNDSQIYAVDSLLDGMFCKKCKEFFKMSCANQPDGTLICWSCKLNPYR